MIVNNTHQKIDALREIVPEGFVFVLDTTDRSFIYKSSDCLELQQFVLSLDKVKGFDLLTKEHSIYTYRGEKQILKLQKLAANTFLGVCAAKDSFSNDKMILAQNYISV